MKNLSAFASLNKTQRRKRVAQDESRPYLVDESNRGDLSLRTSSVVMNNSSMPKDANRLKVTYFITENKDLFTGLNTVAVFHVKLTDPFREFLNLPFESVKAPAISEA